MIIISSSMPLWLMEEVQIGGWFYNTDFSYFFQWNTQRLSRAQVTSVAQLGKHFSVDSVKILTDVPSSFIQVAVIPVNPQNEPFISSIGGDCYCSAVHD